MRALRFLVAIVFSVVFAGPISADVFQLQATADASLQSDAPNINTGGLALLDMDGWNVVGARRPIFRFDLSSIPDGSTIVSASLTVEQIGLADWSGFPVQAWWMPNDVWAEGTVDWNSYDQSGGVLVANLNAPQVAGPRIFDISIADWNYGADLLDNFLTLQTRWGDELSSQYKRLKYSSREGNFVPLLTVTTLAIPEPSAVGLLSVIGLALVARRRRV